MEFLANCGTGLAFLGAALAVGLSCAGSGRGVGLAGEAAAGAVAEDPGNFSKCMILQILPGTQGLYGLVIWFVAMLRMGFFSTGIPTLSLDVGMQFFAACMPMALGGLITAIAQGRCAAACITLTAKRPEESSKGIIFTIMVEFYAILSLLSSILMLFKLSV